MELYMEILAHYLSQQKMEVTFPDVKISPEKIAEQECYQVLRKIKAVIEDDSLEDKECFMKIEKIISLYEALGGDGGNRHDYG